MSVPSTRASRRAWGMEGLPVLAALGLHAASHERWLMCVPAAVLLVFWVWLGRPLAYSPRRLLIAAGVGAGVGVLLLGVSPMPGPIPPSMMGPMCGALVGLSTISTLSERHRYAITYALLLSALSAAVSGGVGVYAGLAGLAVSLLALAFTRGRLARAGLAGVLGFSAYALVVLGMGFGLWRFVRASEGVLTDTVFRLMQAAPRPSGMALQSEISLERTGRMPDSDRLLMEQRGARPERLRTVVLDTFDGSRWKTSRTLEAERLKLTPPQPGEALQRTELTLLQNLHPYLPAPAGTREVRGASPQVLGGWMLRGDGRKGATLTLRHEEREHLPPEPPPDATLSSLPEELRAELLPLARELTRGATTPRAQAKALEAWFRDNHEYSLSVDLSGEGSPLAVLIRERRPAWCSYFASAMAALLRSLGVPTRLAGGFVPQEKNPYSDAMLVRERDAHVWVEVYLAEEGRFVPFDPTPWRSREALLGQKKPGALDVALQALASFFRRWTARLLDSPLEVLGALVGSPVLWLGVAAGVLWRLRTRYQKKRAEQPRAAMRGTDPGLTAAYARYLRTMKRGAGLVPHPTETDDELLGRLRAAHGDRAAGLAEEFLTRYRRARYGGGPLDPATLGALTAELDRTLRADTRK